MQRQGEDGQASGEEGLDTNPNPKPNPNPKRNPKPKPKPNPNLNPKPKPKPKPKPNPNPNPNQAGRPDCYAACGYQGGYCDWCADKVAGKGSACCHSSGAFPTDPEECRGVTAEPKPNGDAYHSCVRAGSARDSGESRGAPRDSQP